MLAHNFNKHQTWCYT